jgi:thiopeptide-type bacteriocin biosynthesis protein
VIDRAGHGSAWVSAHAFFHDDLDLLVTNVVAPLADELAVEGMASELFFLRYWDGGPHLRLRVLPTPGASRGEVQGLVGERFGHYLSCNPSADHMSAAQYAALAPELARKENMRSWTTRPYPNNSVSFIAYRREHERYGHGAAMQAVERHFAESSRIALPVVTLAAPAKRRATLALGCILATWFVGCTDPASLRTWLGNRHRSGAAHPPTAQAGELSRTVELARTARHLAEGGPGSLGDGALASWTRSMTGLRAALSVGQAAVSGADDGVLRVLDLCAHLICNRLGVSIVAEPALRKLAAQAIDSLHSERN